MKIAVINSGSSSIKFQLFDMSSEEVMASVVIEEIGQFNSTTTLKTPQHKSLITSVVKNHHDGLESIINLLEKNNILESFTSLSAIGHRVVHGGEEFTKPTLIDEMVIDKIRHLIPLAPLHNPANVEGIIIARKKAPFVPQIAVFDTAFHSTMPKEAYLYALDYEMYEKYKIRKYGFHGSSHSYVSKQAAQRLNKDISELNLITLHLGNGSSACAIQNGKSIDTSMGFTPLEGLVMGTRSGDLDPAVVFYMQRELSMSAQDVDNLLNKQSGLLGICGERDVRTILDKEDEKSQLAISMMIRRVQKYIGSYIALLGKVDAIVFTGGIGENSQDIRDKVMDSLFFKDIEVLVIKTNEELKIARECFNFLKK